MIKIVQISRITDEVVSAINHLIPQLSSSVIPPTRDELEKMIASGTTTLLAAIDVAHEDEILGVLSLVIFRIPTGLHVWIEDVVVDMNARHKGIGELLIRSALERAEEAGVGYVDLTSRPSREDAVQLYLRLGFQRRQSDIYRFKW